MHPPYPSTIPIATPAIPLIATEPVAAYAIPAGARAVKLFRNGANQAVRIPKEFELPGKEAIMRREGSKLVIELVKPERGTVAALALALKEMAKLGPCEDEFPDVDAGLLPLDDIIFEE